MPTTISLTAIDRAGKLRGYSGALPDVTAEIFRATSRLYDSVGFVEPWVCFLAFDGDIPVGTCGFKSPPADGRVEIAYFTFPEFEGRGVATTMAATLVAIAQRHEPSIVVAAQTLPKRYASHRVLEKLGFRHVATIDHPEDGTVWEWQLPPEPGAEQGAPDVTERLLVKLFEHNNWANLQVIDACSALTPEQLDATPPATSEWSVRHALSHLVESQQGYLSLLTLPREARQHAAPSFAELRESARRSGEGLLELARDEASRDFKTRLRTTDGYLVEPWVVMVQAINHATDHRRQIRGMLRALGVPARDVDGWSFGEAAGAVVPIPP